MHRKTSEPSFIDVLVPDHIGRNDQLDRIDQMIDWPKVAKQVQRPLRLSRRPPRLSPAHDGQDHHPPTAGNASDTAIEEAVSDCLGVGLSVGGKRPAEPRKRASREGRWRPLAG